MYSQEIDHCEVADFYKGDPNGGYKSFVFTDYLSREGIAIEPFKISSISKKEIVEKLAIWIEQKKIRMFYEESAILEYDNFSYKMPDEMEGGSRIKYGARTGYHDDIVMADALAVYALVPILQKRNEEEMTRAQVAYKQATQRADNSYNLENEWREWDAPY